MSKWTGLPAIFHRNEILFGLSKECQYRVLRTHKANIYKRLSGISFIVIGLCGEFGIGMKTTCSQLCTTDDSRSLGTHTDNGFQLA